MSTKVVMPKLGLTMTEGLLVRWLVEDGAEIKKGQPIFEVETDKVVNEAQADVDGVLRIVVDAGSTIPVMGLVGYILAPGEGMLEEGAGVPRRSRPAPQGSRGKGGSGGVGEQDGAAGLEMPGSRALASPAARRRARELGVDINNISGTGEEGRITIADVEAAAEVRAREAAPPEAAEMRASPLAKRLAREAGIDLAALRGSGTGGRITREDVERVIAEREGVGAGLVPAPGSDTDLAARASTRLVPTEAGLADGEFVALSGVRAVIAGRMLASAQGTAAVTLTSTADATQLVAWRDRLNQELVDGLGLRIAYNDILIKILSRALKEYPYMNAHQVEGGVRLMPHVNVGLAVDTGRSLLVVVVRDADQKSIPGISRETRDKAARAIAGDITPDELSGGTFTLTNLGVFGVEAFTPIINPPEVAVLGVGRIEEVPAAYQGQIALRQRLVLSLTFDHRLIDGAPAARFLARVRELIEAGE